MAGVVLLAVFVAGEIDPRLDLFHPGRGSRGSSALSFQQAYSLANASAGDEPGGPWMLVSAAAFSSPVPISSSFLERAVGSPCFNMTTPDIPATGTADRSHALSAWWVFDFVGASSSTAVRAFVTSGRVANVSLVPAASSCLGTGSTFAISAPHGLVDSPALVQHLGNLSTFLGRYPNSTLLLSLGSSGTGTGSGPSGPIWYILASPCPSFSNPSPSLGGPGDPVYSGFANATNGQAWYDGAAPGYGQCLVPGTLGADLQVNSSFPVLGFGPGNYAFPVRIVGAQGGLTAASIRPEVFADATAGGPVPRLNLSLVRMSLELDGTNGTPIATYNFTTQSWSSGASATLVAGETLMLLANAPIYFASLVLVGSAPFDGQVGVYLV